MSVCQHDMGGPGHTAQCMPSGRSWWARTGLCAPLPERRWERGGASSYNYFRPHCLGSSASSRPSVGRATYACPSRTWRLERTTAGYAACVRVTPACSLCRRRAAVRAGRSSRPAAPLAPLLAPGLPPSVMLDLRDSMSRTRSERPAGARRLRSPRVALRLCCPTVTIEKGSYDARSAVSRAS